ncbi:MAG: RNB domain-containing ribonuclease [Candidatus Krumholzibacteriota bacterium]|nr:RNB domain-containing ribonuclease [Candidatus Krumholzibacteriota bacterium]
MNSNEHRKILQDIARRAMIDRGLLPDFSPEALAQLDGIKVPATAARTAVRDLTGLLWSSIDNDDSLDLDQLTVAEVMAGDDIRIFVAIADVDSVVRKGSAIDSHARSNTTSVYTPAVIFPMLPEKLSTDITSLNYDSDRLAIVVEILIGNDGAVKDSDIYPSLVRNKAKLAYNSIAAWLEGKEDAPEAVAAVDGLDENLRSQDRAARRMRELRHSQGALSFETINSRPVFAGEKLSDFGVEHKNAATSIIEDFMIAANGITARYLASRGFPSIRRVVREPKRWDRIVMLAADHKYDLPRDPDAKALDRFLLKEKAADPLRFPDLSLAIIKLMGPGEYVAELPGGKSPGHFGLAVKAYAHSTAPNRRYPDLITQRLLKAALSGDTTPYSVDEIDALAKHCSEKENEAEKVERLVNKSAAALLLKPRIHEKFEALVTGASEKGTWVRLLKIPVEGKLISGSSGLDVGSRVRVELTGVDVERGFIDFARVGR